MDLIPEVVWVVYGSLKVVVFVCVKLKVAAVELYVTLDFVADLCVRKR